ncbi:MAG: beta-propeller fold lactonase family protein [Pyrinomonadaceae bacterium]
MYGFNLDSGALTPLSTTAGVVNPSFLAVDSKQRYLYAVNEIDEFEASPAERLAHLRLIKNQVRCDFSTSNHRAARRLVLSPWMRAGKYVPTANYTGGSVAVLPVRKDGTLGEATDFVQHGRIRT